jgi:hypothetical protein
MVCILNFGEEDKERAVDPREVHRPVVEGTKQLEDVWSDHIPESRVERGTEAVRPGAGQLVHAKEGVLNLLRGERAAKVGRQRGSSSVERAEAETPGRGNHSTQEVSVKTF